MCCDWQEHADWSIQKTCVLSCWDFTSSSAQGRSTYLLVSIFPIRWLVNISQVTKNSAGLPRIGLLSSSPFTATSKRAHRSTQNKSQWWINKGSNSLGSLCRNIQTAHVLTSLLQSIRCYCSEPKCPQVLNLFPPLHPLLRQWLQVHLLSYLSPS